MIVSQDGGISLACKNWDENSADTAVFKARSKALVESFKNSKSPSYLIADCKLYHKANAEFLSKLQFTTLIPSTIKLEKELISSKLTDADFSRQCDTLNFDGQWATLTVD